tara:strand:- start:368 stop:2260 length:1893 start_codon:yes stop_codon:yes gene_type:complete
LKNRNIIKKSYKRSFNYNINGSRGLAVFLVFLFHLNLNYFNGGYIGVDIFFVISGYVISQSLLKIHETKKKFIDTSKLFFKKRILRIVPAIVVLTLVSIIFFKIIFIEKHYLAFLKSIFYSNVFLSNFFFWSESGYFGLENLFKPLLHTWSLSVEIQVYLVLPLLLFFLLKKRYLLFISTILIIIFLSIFFGEVFINRPFVYFFPFFRFHEFLLGAFIFYYLNFLSKKKVSYLFSYIGIVIIIFSSLYLNESSNFPGINSLLPIVGILLIMISDDKKNIILCNNLTQYFGNISYSFYLYHWPVIVAFKYITLKISVNFYDSVVIFLITLILSHLSYNYVELNFKSLKTKRIFNFLLIFIFFITTSYSFNSNRNNEEVNQKNDFLKNEILLRNIYLKKFEDNNYLKKKIFIIGDSHAQDLFISISQDNINLKDYSKIYIPLDDSCLKYLGKKSIIMIIENFIATQLQMAGQNLCNAQIANFFKKSIDITNSNILFSSRWSIDTLSHAEKIFRLLSVNENNLILVNRRPRFFDIPSLLELKKPLSESSFNKLAYQLRDKKIKKINNLIQLKAYLSNIKYLDLTSKVCIEKKSTCIVMHNKNLLFIDNDHFSMSGSKYYSNKIIQEFMKLKIN